MKNRNREPRFIRLIDADDGKELFININYVEGFHKSEKGTEIVIGERTLYSKETEEEIRKVLRDFFPFSKE